MAAKQHFYPVFRRFPVSLPACWHGGKSGAAIASRPPATDGANGAINPARIAHPTLAEFAFWAQISVMAAPDYYATLGVTPDADEAVIRAAWKALLRKYHPDTAHGVPDAADRTRAFNAAWAVLGKHGMGDPFRADRAVGAIRRTR